MFTGKFWRPPEIRYKIPSTPKIFGGEASQIVTGTGFSLHIRDDVLEKEVKLFYPRSISQRCVSSATSDHDDGKISVKRKVAMVFPTLLGYLV